MRVNAADLQIWYPLHPRWMPLLRLVGALGLLGIIYSVVFHRPYSMSSFPAALLVFSCLLVQPELRTPTILNRIGSIAHRFLVFLVLPLALVALTIDLVSRLNLH